MSELISSLSENSFFAAIIDFFNILASFLIDLFQALGKLPDDDDDEDESE